jgi:hypothetical protein
MQPGRRKAGRIDPGVILPNFPFPWAMTSVFRTFRPTNFGLETGNGVPAEMRPRQNHQRLQEASWLAVIHGHPKDV